MKKLFKLLLFLLVTVGCSDDGDETVVSNLKEKNQERIDAIGAEFLKKIQLEKLEDLYLITKKYEDAFKVAPVPDPLASVQTKLVEFFKDLSYYDLLGSLAQFDGTFADLYGKYTFIDNKWLYEESDTELQFIIDQLCIQLVMSGKKQISTNNPMVVPASTTLVIKDGDKDVLKTALEIAKLNLGRKTIEHSGIVRVISYDLSADKLIYKNFSTLDNEMFYSEMVEIDHTLTSGILASGSYDVNDYLGNTVANLNFLNEFYIRRMTPDLGNLIEIVESEDAKVDELNNSYKSTWGYTPSANDLGYTKFIYDKKSDSFEHIFIFKADGSECSFVDFIGNNSLPNIVKELKRLRDIVRPDGGLE